MIGAWGDLVFTVSSERVFTFDGMNRNESARWAKHDVHMKKTKPEFTGVGQGTISFTMQFLASMGVNPTAEIDKLLKCVRSGEAHTLVIGSKRYGVNKWYIASLPHDIKYVDNRGNVLSASVTVNMEEYE